MERNCGNCFYSEDYGKGTEYIFCTNRYFEELTVDCCERHKTEKEVVIDELNELIGKDIDNILEESVYMQSDLSYTLLGKPYDIVGIGKFSLTADCDDLELKITIGWNSKGVITEIECI